MKIWKYITIFFAGIIAGLAFFAKYLVQPTQVNNIKMKKIKTKKSKNVEIDIPIDVQQVQQIKENKKIKLFQHR